MAYQCGTGKPSTGDLGFTPDLYVSVPVTKVAFTSSTYLPWIELLNERGTVKHTIGGVAYISSTCFLQLYNGTSV